MEVLTDPNCTIPTPDPATAPGLFGPGYDYGEEGEEPPVAPVEPDPIAEPRALMARSLLALYAEQTTKAERQAVARELAGAVDLLARVAESAPAEWASWCAGVEAAGGMGEHLRGLRRAVTALLEARRDETRRAAKARRAEQSDATREAIRCRLSTTEKGKVTACYANIVTILKMDPAWASLRMSTLGDVVEHDQEELLEAPGTAMACEWLRDSYGMEAGEVSVKSAIYAVAQTRAYSPVREYLESVRGKRPKGESVIARLLPEVLGIRDGTEMHAAMVRRFLIGAVARALDPGCKMDTALVLIGKQGAKKSTFFEVIFGDAHFGDSPIPIGDKDAPIQLSRTWGYEASELEDLTSKRTAEAAKQFLRTKRDLYRAPFARTARLHPRHSVMCGSANPKGILTDPTGSRSFWVLSVDDQWVIPAALLASLRDAVWAEALYLYEAGEVWWFDRAEDNVREEDAQQYAVGDDWQPLVERWLATPAGQFEPAPGVAENFTRSGVLIGIGIPASQLDRRASARVAAILSRLGWEEVNSPAGFRHQRVWRRMGA